jgi:sigma-B regulation protein RsbU (phosphoserine phosphatase)
MAVTADFFEITPRNWRARLATSVDMMRELSRHSDPDDLFHAFIQRMTQLYPTARQLSITRRGLLRPQFRVTRFSLWADRVNPFKDQHSLPLLEGGILGDLLYADEPRVIDELDVSPDDPAYDYLAGQGSLLAIPLFDRGTATNMVVVTRDETHAFAREQVPELVWMSNLFGRAVQSLVLSDRLQEAYDATDYENRVIADLQHRLLPTAVPRIPGLEVAVHYRTVNRSGGDYYDFFPLPGGKLGVLVADVSGHGTPAAVLMAITHTLAHTYPGPPTQPGAFLAHLNDHLSGRYTGTSGHFITAFYAVVDPARGVLTSSSAGHPAPRVGAGRRWRPMANQQGLPLGVSAGTGAYPEQSMAFGAGGPARDFHRRHHRGVQPRQRPVRVRPHGRQPGGVRRGPRRRGPRRPARPGRLRGRRPRRGRPHARRLVPHVRRTGPVRFLNRGGGSAQNRVRLPSTIDSPYRSESIMDPPG